MKHSILRSFEGLIKGMDPNPPEPELPPAENQSTREERRKQRKSTPRMVVAEGEFLGRKWMVYSDGAFEGETVNGMEAFRDLEHFKAFVEESPLLRTERYAFEEPASEAPAEPPFAEGLPVEPPAGDGVVATLPANDRSTDADRVEPPPRRKIELARDLVITGALGIAVCGAWWLWFYAADVHGELLRRGIGANALRSTDLSVLDRLGCLFANSESCMVVKNWGRFAGHVPYEPAFLWLSICALGAGIGLLLLRRKSGSGGLEP